MKRIFLTLALLSHVIMIVALVLGLKIGDPMQDGGLNREVNASIGTHILIGLGALSGTTLVHALVLTYFMGTGRWIEETSGAYHLPETFFKANQKVKYKTLPGIIISFLMILGTGMLGAVADTATAASLKSVTGIDDGTLHFLMAVCMWIVTLIINLTQYIAISQNSHIVESVLAEVRRIRIERGLEVE
ncbi:MAG: hypothetical protein ACK58L_11365 [Planctomycetota bacterium]